MAVRSPLAFVVLVVVASAPSAFAASACVPSALGVPGHCAYALEDDDTAHGCDRDRVASLEVDPDQWWWTPQGHLFLGDSGTFDGAACERTRSVSVGHASIGASYAKAQIEQTTAWGPQGDRLVVLWNATELSGAASSSHAGSQWVGPSYLQRVFPNGTCLDSVRLLVGSSALPLVPEAPCRLPVVPQMAPLPDMPDYGAPGRGTGYATS